MKDFTDIAWPLYRLTERLATFVWTDVCQNAFNELRRRCLTSAPLRQQHGHWSCVLSQVANNGREHVTAYGSRLLMKAKQRYCTCHSLGIAGWPLLSVRYNLTPLDQVNSEGLPSLVPVAG